MKCRCYIHLSPVRPHEDVLKLTALTRHSCSWAKHTVKSVVTTLLSVDTKLMGIRNSSTCRALLCLLINIKQLFVRAYTCNLLLCPSLLGSLADSLLEI